MSELPSLRPQNSTNVRVSMSRVAAIGALRALDGALPSLAGPVAEWLWFRPERHERPVHEASVLATASPVRIPTGTGSLAGWSWGTGPAVLLVHGWSGRGSQLGAFVSPLLAAGFRVVTFDAPAHGDSDGDEASLFSFADAIQAAARRFGPLHGVIAHSMGAAATAASVRGGLHVPRVVFVAPADPSQAIPRFASHLGLSRATEQHLEDAIVRRFGSPIQTVAATELAAGLDTALLVVHDHDDGWVPTADGRAYVDGAGGAWVETRGLGHHRVLRDAEVVAHAVRWLSDGVDLTPRAPATTPTSPQLVTKGWWSFDLDLLAPEITEEELFEDLNYGR